ncbi:MAG: 4-phosphopantetheinyl transferase [Flavobacteriales bacterium]|nr:MAG: 4-phosphopantetheinyl transferase [Flavobacteriales bacterium]PIE49488.1 MAG: 4-phosphopantetheinyl transferase [Flavobacteriales bacterium]
MPLYKTIKTDPFTKIFIWKIDEPFDELSKGIHLTKHCQNRVNNMKSDLHKRGFMSIRHLLALAGYTDADLFYDNLGKPHLKNGKFISISHSFIFTTIIISEKVRVGIDIERQRDKIIRIAHKFTTPDDYTHLNQFDLIRKLTVVWGAKESIYKIYEQEGLSFLEHIYVYDFELNDRTTTAKVSFNNKISQYSVHFLELEGFTCVYAFEVNSKTFSKTLS